MPEAVGFAVIKDMPSANVYTRYCSSNETERKPSSFLSVLSFPFLLLHFLPFQAFFSPPFFIPPSYFPRHHLSIFSFICAYSESFAGDFSERGALIKAKSLSRALRAMQKTQPRNACALFSEPN